MDKISKFLNKKETILEEEFLFKGKHLKIKDIEGWEVIVEKDCSVAIIHLLEYDQIILRKEYIPSFKHVNDKDFYLTILAGSIEKDETPEQCIKREIYEESGIKLHTFYKGLKLWNKLFLNKGSVAQAHIFYVPVTNNDYERTSPKTDGSVDEARSSCVRIDIKYLNHLNPSDLITALCLEYFKKEISL